MILVFEKMIFCLQKNFRGLPIVPESLIINFDQRCQHFYYAHGALHVMPYGITIL